MYPGDKPVKVLVFAKAPLPGFAKTRLAPLLGQVGAAALQSKLIEHALQTARGAGTYDVELHGDPAEDDFLRSCAQRHGVRLVSQSGGDLGARMHAALGQALATCAQVLLIGSDCPALTREHLGLAATALRTGADAVFVPAEDGGYALIGLTRCDARLFAGIAWSTSEVMDETRARLRKLGWRWRELDTLWDVDTPGDYERLVSSGLLKGGI
jgi:rSAM/selenodomain-associated transferase 1